MNIQNFNVTGGQNVFATNIENLVLNQNNKKEDTKDLVKDLLFACSELQSKKGFHKESENSYNDFIGSILKAKSYQVNLESRKGATLKTGNPGEIDIEILKEDNSSLAICEGMILPSLNEQYIKDHILKVFTYDANGLFQNFIIAYINVVNYGEFVRKYKDLVLRIDYQYPLINAEVKDVSSDYNTGTDMNILRTLFNRNGKEVNLYHLLVSMNRQ
ncbi:MAG: hypothetical protein IPQ05_21540 [Leptospiraceae bacterium]|nr:hypothetical protein [Leptospiraceae bacterium]MBK7056217.1 hypothetical protein [Leptospiraceae bacterium]MBK9501470.1 hypothetical protein [Leptospiraceae bacterium]MBL0266373.1 hypothetical protein [Leptospiraceae bacterium]MBP9889250.1 hypothetical protein [Leptospiraceae bacterium]